MTHSTNTLALKTLFVWVAVLPLFLITQSVLAVDDDGKLRIIVFGAHPDDAELDVGGTAALWARQGHHVKFVPLIAWQGYEKNAQKHPKIYSQRKSPHTAGDFERQGTRRKT